MFLGESSRHFNLFPHLPANFIFLGGSITSPFQYALSKENIFNHNYFLSNLLVFWYFWFKLTFIGCMITISDSCILFLRNLNILSFITLDAFRYMYIHLYFCWGIEFCFIVLKGECIGFFQKPYICLLMRCTSRTPHYFENLGFFWGDHSENWRILKNILLQSENWRIGPF